MLVMGRGAAVGDALSNLLAAAGYDVTREFYINDAGRQVRLLAESVYCSSENKPIPEDGYHGDYINEIAASAKTIISDIKKGFMQDQLARKVLPMRRKQLALMK